MLACEIDGTSGDLDGYHMASLIAIICGEQKRSNSNRIMPERDRRMSDKEY